MRFLLVLAFAIVAVVGTELPRQGLALQTLSDQVADYVKAKTDSNELEYVDELEDDTVDIENYGLISWQVRRFIRKLQKQMACGFPQYGVPPLAPLRVTEYELTLHKSIMDTFDKVFRMRIDGLDGFKINKLSVHIFMKKVKFDFTFPLIKATAQKYETDTLFDAMRQLGLSVEYEGDGTLGFGLRNLRVKGVMKYKLPILIGSAKITSLKTTVTLEKADSEIAGIMGDGSINRLINHQIEHFVESFINNNQKEISDMIENTLVPRVNKQLKGKDFWSLIDLIFSSSNGEKEDDPIVVDCDPDFDPWA